MNALKSAVLTLILRFVDRQQIAFDALLELRPHFLTFRLRNETGVENPNAHRTIPKRKRRCQPPQIGAWGDWDYFVHGLGVLLTHRVTQEPIEWDAANVNEFDRYWFVNYVAWMLEQAHNDEVATIIGAELERTNTSLMNTLFRVLDQLVAAGVLSGHEHSNKYTVLL